MNLHGYVNRKEAKGRRALGSGAAEQPHGLPSACPYVFASLRLCAKPCRGTTETGALLAERGAR